MTGKTNVETLISQHHIRRNLAEKIFELARQVGPPKAKGRAASIEQVGGGVTPAESKFAAP